MVAACVLGLMGCMATAGLVLALMTVSERRANDTGLKNRPHRPLAPPPQQAEVESRAPGAARRRLEALGYLPRDTGLIVAADIAELLSLPAGQQLLHRPFELGKARLRFDHWAEWTGLRLEDIDHLAIGLKMDQSLLPWLTAVVRAREPFDPEELRNRLKGERVASEGKHTVFRIFPPDRKWPLAMCCPDKRTVVLASVPEHLVPVPVRPVDDLAQLPPELQDLLRTRSESGSPLWVAGHVEEWLKSPARLVLDKNKREELGPLLAIQTFGLWVDLARGVMVKGAFRCKDAAQAKALDDFFRAPSRAANSSLITVLDSPWLSLQVQVDLASLQKPGIP
jgi:hypothetical protein